MGAARKLNLESNEVQQRLGEPTQLAIFAAEQYHARSFWGRHPAITYLLGPLPMVLGMYWLYLLAAGVIMYCAEMLFGEWARTSGVDIAQYPWLQALTLTVFTWGLCVLPPFAVALLLCRVYRRNALASRWPMIGCALLALVAAMLHFSWRLKVGPSELERGMLLLSLPIEQMSSWGYFNVLSRFALAFGIGLLLVKRAQQRLDLMSN